MFEEFPKVARLTRDCVITEKIDGTNAQVHIIEASSGDLPDHAVMVADVGNWAIYAGSRSRYLSLTDDNFGFAKWVHANATALVVLGEGRHYGEWWGSGIQRGYGLQKGEKRFSLFNVARWADDRDREKFPADRPACCSVVPVLYAGPFHTDRIDLTLDDLSRHGSKAAPGFNNPEGVVIWHEAARVLFKKTIVGDAEGKEQKARRLAVTT